MLIEFPRNLLPYSLMTSSKPLPFNSPLATFPVPFLWHAISQLSPITPSGTLFLNFSKSFPPHILS